MVMEDSGTVWTDQLWFQADLMEVKQKLLLVRTCPPAWNLWNSDTEHFALRLNMLHIRCVEDI